NQRFETEMALGARTIPEAIAVAAGTRKGQVIIQDVTLHEVTYKSLLAGTDVLAAQWKQMLYPEARRVGVLLPNANPFPAVLLSLWAESKVPAILNYTTGPAILKACAELAELRQVITSKTFVDRAKLDLDPLRKGGIELIFLEDVRGRI